MKKIIIIFICIAFSICAIAQSTGKSEFTIDTLIINKNDNRFFEAESTQGNILKFKEVSAITDSLKTITVKLTFNEGMGAMLKIYNPFPEQLVYKAELYSYKKKEYVATSTLPIFLKLSSFETWPYNIDQIRLTGFKVMKE